MSEKRNISLSTTYSTSNILFDLEGVLHNFDKEVIISFVSEHVEDFLNKNWESKSLQEAVQILRDEAKCNEQQKVEGNEVIPEGENEDVKQAILKIVLQQIKSKHYSEGYKKIQKEICADGFKSGNLKVKFCDNVDSLVNIWSEEGKQIFVLSSYKTDEMKLLLSNTEKGDILPLISGQFDEEIGPKNEKETYSKILKKIGCVGSDLMFISDKVENAEAAAYSGLVSLVISKGAIQQNTSITIVNSISDIEFEASTKKRKVNDDSIDTESGLELQKPNVSDDVEMTDISENGETEKQKHSEKLECGQGDSIVCKSAEAVNGNIITELGDGDAEKNSVTTDIMNNHENTSMETETSDTEHVNKENLKKEEFKGNNGIDSEDTNVVVAESMKSNGLQSSFVISEKLDDTPVHKTEELKTDESVENLDKKDKLLDACDASVSNTISSEGIEEVESVSALTGKEKLADVKGSTEEKKVDQIKLDPINTDSIPVNSASDEGVQEEKVSTQPEQNSVDLKQTKEENAEGKSEQIVSTENMTTESEKVNGDNCCKLESDKQENMNTFNSDVDTNTPECEAEKKHTANESVTFENETNMDIDCKKSLEDRTENLISSESTSVNNKEGIEHPDSEKIEPEKPSEDMSTEPTENQIKVDITNTDKDKNIEGINLNVTYSSTPEADIDTKIKPEFGDKQCNLEVNTDVEIANKELDKPAENNHDDVSPLAETEQDIKEEANDVNVSQSSTSNVISDVEKTKLETVEVSEEKKIEKPCLSSGQNGVNGNGGHENAELEVNGTIQNGVVENGKHVNGDALTNVDNLPSAEKKVVENSVKTGTEIEA